MNVVLLSRTADRLLKFSIRHTTVIPGPVANCCDRLICRYMRETHQTRGIDVSMELRIGENRGYRCRQKEHDYAGKQSGGDHEAECPES